MTTQSIARPFRGRGLMATPAILLAAALAAVGVAPLPAQADRATGPAATALRAAPPGSAFGDGMLTSAGHGTDEVASSQALEAAPETPIIVRSPAIPANLPRGIEVMSPYVEQSSCEWTDKPGAIAFGDLLRATYPDTSYGVMRPCTGVMNSEHYDGRAVDWMNTIRKPTQAAQANAVLAWLFASDAAGHTYANARRLGIMYIIWNGQIWGSYHPTWRPYHECAKHPEVAADTECHRDHMHFSLSWAGAMKKTSYWTRSVADTDYGPCPAPDLNYAPPRVSSNPAPCPAHKTLVAPVGSPPAYAGLVRFSGAVLTRGTTGNPVKALQTALGLTADGSFGPKTGDAVVAFKTAHALPGTATVDAATWRALLTAFRPTPLPGPVTNPAVTAPTAKVPPKSPLTPYRNLTLKVGSKGAAVTALQKRLKVTPVTGTFATKTQAAVRTFQRTHHLAVTGVVDRTTWAALGA